MRQVGHWHASHMVTSWSLKVRPGIVPGEVADRVTHTVWRVLASRPELRDLYPGYWVAIRAVVREHLRDACVPGDRCDRVCPAFRGLHACGDLEAFSGAMAADVVCRLEHVLRGMRVLPLVANELPDAIERALASVRPSDRIPGRKEREVPCVVHVDAVGIWISG